MAGEFNENNPMVPSQDSTHNVQSRDVVGNKTDTSAVPSGTTSLVAITKKIYDEVVSMSDASELFGKSGPSSVEIDDDATYALELYDVGDDVPTTGEITPGNYQIDRIRNAVLSPIVTSTPASEATGRIYCSEVFAAVDGWSIGDMVFVTFSGGSVVHSGSTTVLPNAYFYSRIARDESIETEVAKIPKSDAAVIWNDTALQAIQDEAEDALEGENLDHLQAVATVAADMTAEVVDGSIISRILSKLSDTSSYDPTTDSLEMQSDKTGAFSGDGGALQDDSVKASLDLAHTDLDAIKASTDKQSGESPTTGTASQNWYTSESNIVSIGTNDTKKFIHSLLLLIDEITAGSVITIRIYTQINNVERKVYDQPYTKGTDPDGIWVIDGTVGIHEVLRVTAQSDTALDDGKNIDYDVMTEAM